VVGGVDPLDRVPRINPVHRLCGIHRIRCLGGIHLFGSSRRFGRLNGIDHVVSLVLLAAVVGGSRRRHGTPYEVGRGWFERNPKSILAGATEGLIKLVFRRIARELLGVHILGDIRALTPGPVCNSSRWNDRSLRSLNLQRTHPERGLQVRRVRWPSTRRGTVGIMKAIWLQGRDQMELEPATEEQ
jgi:hypothetical protein